MVAGDGDSVAGVGGETWRPDGSGDGRQSAGRGVCRTAADACRRCRLRLASTSAVRGGLERNLKIRGREKRERIEGGGVPDARRPRQGRLRPAERPFEPDGRVNGGFHLRDLSGQCGGRILAEAADVQVAPLLEGAEHGRHAEPELREAVLHLGRHFGVNLAHDEPVHLKLA